MADPVRPSSLIKVSRWSLLAFGIFYGYNRNKYLSAREQERREIEEKERPAREAAMKREKDAKNREELAYLEKETGIKFAGGAGGGSDGGSSGGSGGDCGCEFKF